MLRTIEQFIDAQFLTMVFAAIAAGATVLTLAMPLLARDTLSMRMKAVAFERERIRLRERERLAQGNKVTLRQSPRAYMNTVVQNFNLSKWVGRGEGAPAADTGRLSRARALCHLLVLSHGDADRHAAAGAVLRFRRDPARSADLDQARHRHRRRLFRHVEPEPLPEEQDPAAADLDQAGISRCARFAPDLRRIRNVGGGGVSKGQRRSRHAIGRACRGIYADDRRAVLFARSPAGLRQSGAARGPRRREGGLPRLAAGGALRHAARYRRCGCWRRKTATCACRKRKRKLPPCRRSSPCR